MKRTQQLSQDREQFGPNLKRLRLQARFEHQKQLAEAMLSDVPEDERSRLPHALALAKQISGWETGAHCPSNFYKGLLCRALKCNLWDLDPTVDRPSQEEEAARVAQLLSRNLQLEKESMKVKTELLELLKAMPELSGSR